MAKFVPLKTAEELFAAAQVGLVHRRSPGWPAFPSCINTTSKPRDVHEAQVHLDGSLGILVEDDEDLQL